MPDRTDLLFLSALPALSALAATSGPARIPNVTLDADRAKLDRQSFGDVRIYFDGPTDQLHAMTARQSFVEAGHAAHPPHQHPEEEMMGVTEGTGEIVKGKSTKVGPGTMMYCANKLHGVKNTGKQPLLFYFYKWKV
jgi:mannose-6-phosphate isomerase-like protein (cupin superfamily)